MKKGVGLGVFVMGILLMPLLAGAQPGGGQGGPGGPGGPGGGFGPGGQGGPGGGGGFNMLQMLQEQIGATDEEWAVIQPKLQKVMDLQQQTGGRGGRGGRGGFGGGGPGGGPGGPGGPGAQGGRGPGGQQADSAVSRAMNDLRTTLENTSASNEMIQAKLTALRSAREKARTDLAAAQSDLKNILTPKQEAVLVTFGMLD